MTDDTIFDDDISSLFGGTAERKELPQKAVEYLAQQKTFQKTFEEGCPACGGTGRWKGIRPCFKCKSTGKLTFKTSPQQREASRVSTAKRKSDKLEDFAASYPEIMDWLKRSGVASAKPFPFAVSLQENLLKFGSLTDGQINAARNCIARYQAAIDRNKAQKENAEKNAATVNATKLENAFAHANKAASRPGAMGVWMKPLHLQSGDFSITFTNGYGKWAGTIFVKSGERKLGMIRSGKYMPYGATEAEQAAVLDCCNDPAKAAVAYGKAWSVCAVCHRTLTNDESIERGIGPICAEKFGW